MACWECFAVYRGATSRYMGNRGEGGGSGHRALSITGHLGLKRIWGQQEGFLESANKSRKLSKRSNPDVLGKYFSCSRTIIENGMVFSTTQFFNCLHHFIGSVQKLRLWYSLNIEELLTHQNKGFQKKLHHHFSVLILSTLMKMKQDQGSHASGLMRLYLGRVVLWVKC